MGSHPLSMAPADSPSPPDRGRLSRKEKAQALYERLWLQNPEQFNPERNVHERERLQRSWEFLLAHVSVQGMKGVDLGSGQGLFARRLLAESVSVEAVDIASRALENLSDTSIPCRQEYFPESHLPDDGYDLVVALDLLAELDSRDYRLFFSELHRIVSSDGWILVSSPLDIYTDGGLEKLIDLVGTELDVQAWEYSYHALYIRVKKIFSAPERWARAWRDPHYRQQEEEGRSRASRWWWRLQSRALFAWLWWLVQYPLRPFLSWLRQSRSCLLFLEKICRTFSSLRGVSHVLFLAKPRILLPKEDPSHIPEYRRHKRQVWE